MINDYIRNEKNKKLLLSCPLFHGMTDDGLLNALAFFDGTIKHFKKGEYVQTLLSPVERFGLMLSGTVQVYCDDIDGHNMIMATVERGETFAESLCFTGIESYVYIRAVTDAEILMLSTKKLRSAECDISLATRFTEMLARRALAMNDRIQVLSKISIRQKIVTLLSQYRIKFGKDNFILPFDRTNMAKYLGIDRASLSRELSKMKSEGLIDFDKNKFIIKKI